MRFSAADLIFLVFSITGGVVVYALTQHRIRPVISLAATLALAFGLSQILAHTSRELRPFQDHPVHQLIPHAGGVSMPSDHATAAFAIAFAILAFFSRRAGIALGAAAMLIAFARVWCGLHYPGDILASAIIAALSTLMIVVIGHGPQFAGTSAKALALLDLDAANHRPGVRSNDQQAAPTGSRIQQDSSR